MDYEQPSGWRASCMYPPIPLAWSPSVDRTRISLRFLSISPKYTPFLLSSNVTISPPPPHCLPQAAMVTLSLCDNVSSIFFPPFNFLHYLGVKVRERILRNSEMPKVPSLRICVLFCMYNTYHTIHAYLQQNPVHHYQKRATPRLGTVTPSSPLFLSPSTNGVPEHTLSGWYISSAVPPVQ